MSVKITLQVAEGPDKGKVARDLAPPVTIGRDPDNALFLDDDRLSRFHVRIEAHGRQLLLRDLNSTNGTRVNGEVVVVRVLRPGDRIDLGRSSLICGSPEELADTGRRLGVTMPAGAPDSGSGAPGGGPDSVLSAGFGETAVDPSRADLSSTIDLPGAASPGGADPLGLGADLPADDVDEARRPTEPIVPVPGLSLAQAAQLIEILTELHRALAHATGQVVPDAVGDPVVVPRAVWRRIVDVQSGLARRIGEMEEGARPED